MRYLCKCLLLFSLLPVAVAADLSAPCAYPSKTVALGQPAPAAGKLLVASREMEDPYFRHKVIYLLAHDNEGTLGLIVNHPLGIALSQILSEDMAADIGTDNANRHEVRFGGPVLMMRVMMLVRDQTDRAQMQRIDDHTYFSEDRRAIERVLKQGQRDDHARFFVGHAGWSPGQLEVELLAGAWFVIEADEKTLFSDDTGDLWDKLIEQLDPPGLLVHATPVVNPVNRLETNSKVLHNRIDEQTYPDRPSYPRQQTLASQLPGWMVDEHLVGFIEPRRLKFTIFTGLPDAKPGYRMRIATHFSDT